MRGTRCEMSSIWNSYSKVTPAPWIWAAVAAAFSALCFAFEARTGFNIADEGFLWYGARQVVSGAVPVRDFQSYDVARYYLTAGVMATLGDDGILAMRTCLGLVQAVGVALAVYLVHINVPRLRLLYAVLTAAVFVCWIMVHPYKNFDVVACIVLIAGLAFALSKPGAFRWFVAGAAIGIAAMLGCNHGVYGAAAGVGAVVYACWGQGWRRRWQAAAWLSIGLVIGYLPNIIMIAAIPGLGSAYWAGIIWLFEAGTSAPADTLALDRFCRLCADDGCSAGFPCRYILFSLADVRGWRPDLRRPSSKACAAPTACYPRRRGAAGIAVRSLRVFARRYSTFVIWDLSASCRPFGVAAFFAVWPLRDSWIAACGERLDYGTLPSCL
jgi:hypothetical protein